MENIYRLVNFKPKNKLKTNKDEIEIELQLNVVPLKLKWVKQFKCVYWKKKWYYAVQLIFI